MKICLGNSTLKNSSKSYNTQLFFLGVLYGIQDENSPTDCDGCRYLSNNACIICLKQYNSCKKDCHYHCCVADTKCNT